MLEVVIERWTDAKGATGFLWSVWDQGRRLTMGPRSHPAAAVCEAEARAFCQSELGRQPDRVTRL